MTNQTLLGLAVVFGLLAYGAKKASASSPPGSVATGPDAVDDLATHGVNLEHVKSSDTSTTAFPVEIWSDGGADAKTGVVYATNDASSFVQFTKTKAGKVAVVRKGLGGFTGAIIKQL